MAILSGEPTVVVTAAAAGSSETAILLLDFQNEFAKEGGRLHGNVSAMMEKTGMLGKVPHVVRTARKSGALIIHSPVIMKGEAKSSEEEFDPQSCWDMDGLFVQGTWNCEFALETRPAEDDVILTHRKNFNALAGTNLKSLLERNGIRRLFLMGFLTNVSIEETARAASENLPMTDIFVLSDGCAAMSEADHFNAIGATIPPLATVVTCSEAEKMLRLPPPPTSVQFQHGEIGSIPQNANRPEVQTHYRPRILALHGARSNDNVTKLQLENLRISDEDYDIVYLRGPIEVEEGDPELVGLVHGPFYSWIDPDEQKLGPSLIAAVHDVLTIVKCQGPFDGIYGFSSGGVVAALAAGIMTDPALRSAIEELEVIRGTLATQSTQGTLQAANLEAGELMTPPFRFAVLACSASPAPNLSTLRQSAGLPTHSHKLQPGMISTKSFHLIGIEDDFKAKSEEVVELFADPHVMYLPGGHIVSRDERSDAELCSSLEEFMHTLGSPPPKTTIPNFIPMSNVSSVSLLPHAQVALVKLDHDQLPEGLYAQQGGSTIRALLEARPAEKPFLYIARGTNKGAVTTYGDVSKFINGGDGDLRHLGVKAGEVVAYGAPPGGAAAAALAFLSIAAQTAAAPLAPSTAAPDALDALDQFKARHLILFQGVDCPGVEEAFMEYAAKGKAKLHRAIIAGNDHPGMFKYVNEGNGVTPKEAANGLDGVPLANPIDGTCLLLRTSGTTARPKGVPLQQGALITNGAILAASMGLQESDVCYSVMPLFHIGGISASILCTLASGGAVSCDGEPFDPERMVDALAISRPQPTWYSSVPTIHNATVAYLKDIAPSIPKYAAYGINSDGIWVEGHSLRMIRSGAAALLGPDGDALASAYGGVPIYPTYSMSEQMPISQPPAGKTNTLTAKPGSVGVPVAASTAIVSRSRLRPQPYGVEGEIAISGPTVLKNYLNNPDADRKSYFHLTLHAYGVHRQDGLYPTQMESRYFLTGDVGTIDSDGFLSIKGRAKELIKKGGEQVSPFEIEEPLLDHPWVQRPVCFAVPSKLYGEEVGCALVLSPAAPKGVKQRDVVVAMRTWLKDAKLAPVKWPTKWVICNDSDLPKTKTKKYIRIGLSTALGLDPQEDEVACPIKEKGTAKAKIDWGTLGGLRFCLACYVMFMHIGSNESWGAFNNLRGFPWHVHLFFTLGGYSMASPMNPAIKKKFKYFLARIGSMYPMYAMALFFGLINLLVVCRPSTFTKDFHWDAQPNDLYTEDGKLAPLFCEGTPATKSSYWASLFLTILTYIFGMAVTPFWPVTWWLGYYLWFSSMYYQCLAIFPSMYNALFNRARKNVALLLKLILTLMVLNALILSGAWFIWKDAEGYNHYDPDTGARNPPKEYNNASIHNASVLSFYLFGPFWMINFVIGACTAFLYDGYRPAEKHSARIWGWLADGITLIFVALSVAHIAQGTQEYGENQEFLKYMRPHEADSYTDTSQVNRLWDNVYARFFAPLTTLWMFSLSTGQGVTAWILRSRFLSETLAPNSYNCFLFHQMVAQWYFAATRNGHWWNWWRYRKTMYWFSPEPCPVEWYEYFFVVTLVVFFSRLMTSLVPVVSNSFAAMKRRLKGEVINDEEEDTAQVLCKIIDGMTGIKPELDWTLEDCGLASIGVPVVVGLLNKAFSTKDRAVAVTASDLVTAKTIGDMVEVVDKAKELAGAQGV